MRLYNEYMLRYGWIGKQVADHVHTLPDEFSIMFPQDQSSNGLV
jgi:hypothetical protein